MPNNGIARIRLGMIRSLDTQAAAILSRHKQQGSPNWPLARGTIGLPRTHPNHQ